MHDSLLQFHFVSRKWTFVIDETKSNNCLNVIDAEITHLIYFIVNFLNVDVEGSEFNALKGLDLNIYKPKIITVETSPPYDLDRKYKKKFRDDKFKIKSYLNKHDYTILYEDLVNTWFCKKRNYKSFKKKISFPISKLYDNFITFQHFQSLVNKK